MPNPVVAKAVLVFPDGTVPSAIAPTVLELGLRIGTGVTVQYDLYLGNGDPLPFTGVDDLVISAGPGPTGEMVFQRTVRPDATVTNRVYLDIDPVDTDPAGGSWRGVPFNYALSSFLSIGGHVEAGGPVGRLRTRYTGATLVSTSSSVGPNNTPIFVQLPSMAGHVGDVLTVSPFELAEWDPPTGGTGTGGLPLEKSYILPFTIGVNTIPIDLTVDFDPVKGVVGKKYVVTFGSGCDAQGLPAGQLGWTGKTDTTVLITTDGQFEGPVNVTITQTGSGFSGTGILLPTDTLADGRQGKRVLFVDEQGQPLTLAPPYPVLLSSSVDLDDLVTVPTLGNDLQLTDGFSLVGPGTANVQFDWALPLPAISPPLSSTPDPTALHKAGAEDISGVKRFLLGADPVLAAGDHVIAVEKSAVPGTPSGAVEFNAADGADADATHDGQPGGGFFFQAGKGGDASATRPAGLSGFVFCEGAKGGKGSATQPPGGGDVSGFAGALPGDLNGWAGATDTIPGGAFQINGGNRGDYLHARAPVLIGNDGLSPVLINPGGSQPIVAGNQQTEVTVDGQLDARIKTYPTFASLPSPGGVGNGRLSCLLTSSLGRPTLVFAPDGVWRFMDGTPAS